jgi:predicted RNA-binding Zn ribbon-like protein
MDIDPELLPLIGEPLPVEFANTLYLRPGHETDFLSSSPWIVAWFDRVATESPSPIPRQLTEVRSGEIRAVRNAMHGVLSAVTLARSSGRRLALPPGAVGKLNETAGQVRCRYRLSWNEGENPSVDVMPIGRGFDVACSYLAIECLSFIAGPDLDRVQRCDGPDCPMFFVQKHHKRRFCQEGCAHRARQARYYRAQRATA